MAREVLIDAYGCDPMMLDDTERIRNVATRIVDDMGSKILDQHSHHFVPQGITFVAILSTSHLAIHTWPESCYAAIDVFSCSRANPQQIEASISRAFGATYCHTRCIERDTGGRQ